MSDPLIVRPVTEENWSDLEALFESKGAPSDCWCTLWRPMPNRTRASNAERKAALHRRVRDGVPVGLLGYVGAEPVAWCSVGPRETLRPLKQGQTMERGNVWSVVCFFVRRAYRGRGLCRQMLEPGWPTQRFDSTFSAPFRLPADEVLWPAVYSTSHNVSNEVQRRQSGPGADWTESYADLVMGPKPQLELWVRRTHTNAAFALFGNPAAVPQPGTWA